MNQEKVFLTEHLSHEVQKNLKRKNPEYQIDDKKREFNKQDLENIEIIYFDANDSIEYLRYFKNLKHINLTNEKIVLTIDKDAEIIKEPGFFDKNISEIARFCPNLEQIELNSIDSIEHLSKFKNIKDIYIDNMANFDERTLAKMAQLVPGIESLSITECDDLQMCKFDKESFKELKSLTLSLNENLEKVAGINNLSKIERLDVTGNSNLNTTSKALITQFAIIRGNKLIEDGQIVGLNDFLLDVRMFPYCRSLNINPMLKNSLAWCEQYSNDAIGNKFRVEKNKPIKYTTMQMEYVDKVANNIIQNLIKPTDTQEEKFAILYTYLRDNIVYDKKGLEERIEKAQYGKSHINGILRGFSEGRVVCEGYSRMLQYLLDKCHIDSQLVCSTHCTSKEQRDRLLNSKVNMEENHSMLITDFTSGRYINDLTFDAGRYQRRYKIRTNSRCDTEYALLTLEQMDLAHQDKSFDEKLNYSNSNFGAIFNKRYQTNEDELSKDFINSLMYSAQQKITERNPKNIDFIVNRKDATINMQSVVRNAIKQGLTTKDLDKNNNIKNNERNETRGNEK